jgi:putative phage-type endonuclease
MDNELQDLRRQGIGGSDIAAIVGLNPFRTAHDLWCEKTGLVEPPEVPSEAAYWGLQFEEILCNEYARRENVRLYRPPVAGGIVRSPTESWVMGSPDRLVEDGQVGMDAKMAGLRQAGRWGEEGTDAVPEEYLLQAQWYLSLIGAQRWDLAVLLGQQFRIYRINPHKDLQQALHDIGARFWFEHVLTKVPPPVDHTEGARRMLDKIYPIQRDEIRPATDEEMALATSYRQQQHAAQEAEIKLARLRNLLCDRIGLAEGIVGPDFKFTWKRIRDSQHTDWEGVAQAFRKLGQIPDTAVADILRDYTTSRPGQRRFRSTYQEDADG